MATAVIGTGISGLACARQLALADEPVVVFEAAQKIGGHTATIDVSTDSGDYAVDTGFIVYNDWTYPNFIEPHLSNLSKNLSNPTQKLSNPVQKLLNPA